MIVVVLCGHAKALVVTARSGGEMQKVEIVSGKGWWWRKVRW